VLDLSKGELPSYGVEDQFAKSDYLPMSAVARYPHRRYPRDASYCSSTGSLHRHLISCHTSPCFVVCGSTGLAEVKVIGKFSPRMQPLNPSGDAHLKVSPPRDPLPLRGPYHVDLDPLRGVCGDDAKDTPFESIHVTSYATRR
jgi:hypothetical protein